MLNNLPSTPLKVVRTASIREICVWEGFLWEIISQISEAGLCSSVFTSSASNFHRAWEAWIQTPGWFPCEQTILFTFFHSLTPFPPLLYNLIFFSSAFSSLKLCCLSIQVSTAVLSITAKYKKLEKEKEKEKKKDEEKMEVVSQKLELFDQWIFIRLLFTPLGQHCYNLISSIVDDIP